MMGELREKISKGVMGVVMEVLRDVLGEVLLEERLGR